MEHNKARSLKKDLIRQFVFGQRQMQLSYAGAGSYSPLEDFQDEMYDKVQGASLLLKGPDDYQIQVYTDGAISDRRITSYFGIQIEELHTINLGKITPCNLRSRNRPAYPGSSAGHFQVSGGTLGCFIQDEIGKKYILSNNHVLANSNQCGARDVILQPGVIDGGKNPRDQIGELHEFVPIIFNDINKVDCAVASVLNEDWAPPNFSEDFKLNVPSDAFVNQKVEKFGRNGRTVGVVKSIEADFKADFNVDPGRSPLIAYFEDQIEIHALDDLINKRLLFSEQGDSGSIILDFQSHSPIGLLSCRFDDGITFANPISEVLKSFKSIKNCIFL